MSEENITSTSQDHSPDFYETIRIALVHSLPLAFVSFYLPFVSAQLIGATGIQLGLLFSIRLFGSLLSPLVCGVLTDHISKKKLICVGSIGNAIALGLLFYAVVVSSLELIGIGIFLSGLSISTIRIPLDIMISQKSSSQWRTHAYSARLRYNGIGSLFGTCISVVFLVVFSYVLHFSAFFIYLPLLIFAGIAILGTFRFMREVSEEYFIINQSSTSINHEISHPNASFQLVAGISILCVVYFLIGINLSIAKPFTQLLVYEKITHDQLLIFLIFIPSSFIAMIVAPQLAETSNYINPYLAIIIICIAGALATILLLLTSSGIIFTLVLLVDSAIAYTGGVLLKRYLSQSSQQHNLGKIFGLVNVMPVLGMIIGPIFGGYMRDAFGSTFPFIISIFVELILIIPYLIGIRLLLTSRILPSPPNAGLVNSSD